MPDNANQPKDARTAGDAGNVDEKSSGEGNKSDETVELFNDMLESKDDDCGRG